MAFARIINVNMGKSKTNSKNYTLFFLSILLWTQLVSGFFLFSWRYKLIFFDNWGIYIAPVSEDFSEFLQFVDSHCPENSSVAYLTYADIPSANRRSIVRYELYPRFVHMLDLVEANSDETHIHINDQIKTIQPECLVVEGVVGDLSIPGEKFMFDEENYLLILSARK